MRLWSLHPKYLDAKGLVALWQEALLAQAVLGDQTRGYRNHPQLVRFRAQAAPLAAISLYLKGVHIEAEARNYSFEKSKIRPVGEAMLLTVTTGQIGYEWEHLQTKLKLRDPALYLKWQAVNEPEVHPLFQLRPGGIESWERP